MIIRQTVPVVLEIETHSPGTDTAVRIAELKMNGITLFGELVYDTDFNQERTAEQAARNLLLLFKEELKRSLGSEES